MKHQEYIYSILLKNQAAKQSDVYLCKDELNMVETGRTFHISKRKARENLKKAENEYITACNALEEFKACFNIA